MQWDVIERAFVGHATLVLIGDPKQAIYAFRGGDIVTYLQAAETARPRSGPSTPTGAATQPLVERLPVGAARRRPRPRRTSWCARSRPATQRHRLAGAPHNDPFRLRVVTREQFGLTAAPAPSRWTTCAPHVAADLAADVKRAARQRRDVRRPPGPAGDVAVIVEAHRDARACRDALAAAGCPGRLHRRHRRLRLPGRRRLAVPARGVRAAAPQRAGAGGRDHDVLREYRRQPRRRRRRAHRPGRRDAARVGRPRPRARHRGGLEAAYVAGMAAAGAGLARRRAAPHRPRAPRPAAARARPTASGSGCRRCSTGCATSARSGRGAAERNRRLDSDAAAVQIMTVWVSKGLQYPARLPARSPSTATSRRATTCSTTTRRPPLPRHRRSRRSRASPRSRRAAAQEMAGDDIRLTYVALTRAQSQVVAWWAPSWDEPQRRAVPAAARPRARRGRGARPLRAEGLRRRRARAPSELGGGGRPGRRARRAGGPRPRRGRRRAPGGLGVRRFDRPIDTTWRRTSYSGADPGRRGDRRRRQRARGRGALDDEVAASSPPAGAGRAGRRADDLPVADGRPARGRDVRLAGARRARARRPVRRPTSRPSCAAASREQLALVAGRRRPPRSSPPRWCRCTTRRWARSPPG